MRQEITREKKNVELGKVIQTYNVAQGKIREMLMTGSSLKEIVGTVNQIIENFYPQSLPCIHHFDNDRKLLKTLSGGSLPIQYQKLIDSIPVGPDAPSCGIAVYRKQRIISTDIANDSVWKNYQFALDFNLRACWSQPILSYNRERVLGTFTMYFREPRKPCNDDICFLESIADLAGTAIEWSQGYNQQRDAEEALYESSRYNQLILESINEGILGLDINGVITFMNTKASQLLGYAANELMNKNFHQLIFHSNKDGTVLTLEQCPVFPVLQNGITVYSKDDVFWKKGKTFFNVEFSSTPIKENDEIIGAVITFRDITQNVEALKKLNENEQQFRLLAESSSDIIVRSKPTGELIYISPSVETILGYSQTELIGQLTNEYYHPEDRDKVRKCVEQALLTDQRIIVRFRFKAKDGAYIWIESYAKVIRNEKGEPLELHSVNRDITGRKIVEEKLEKETEYLKVILENVNDGILACDENGRIAFSNIAASKYNIPSLDTDFDNMALNVFYKDGIRRMKLEDMPLKKAFRGEKVRNYEFVYKVDDGTFRILLADGQPIYNRSGQKIGAVVVIHDVTAQKITERELHAKNEALTQAYQELKLAEESLRKMNAELEERVSARTKELENEKAEAESRNKELHKINADLDNFVYTASHDLKAPISNIEGLINEIKVQYPNQDDEMNQLIHMMYSSVERFKNTISELSEITKVQKSMEEEQELIKVDKLFDEVKEGLRAQIDESEAHIIADFSNAPEICFSKKNLRSVIFNLLSNAIKYRHPGRNVVIKVTTESFGDFTMLAVEDNGLGIAPAQIGKIFSMFKRLHAHVEGSGVGLYLVKRIVENVGGKIEVESELGKGALFKVFFNNKI